MLGIKTKKQTNKIQKETLNKVERNFLDLKKPKRIVIFMHLGLILKQFETNLGRTYYLIIFKF